MTHEDLAELTATELARLVSTREASSVEVVRAALERVERLDPELNAVVTLNERALEEARTVDSALARGEPPGPLCGVPVGIKDTTPVAGLRTTYGSPLFRDHVPHRDALVVERLRKAGAIVLGKTNTPEFAAGGNTYNEVFGRTRNPWNPALSAGGSTGGGAAAVAAGMIGLAEGTDLGGSLRVPAAFCGLVGIRPSPGLVPTWPTDDPWDDLSVTGPMARTAADVALGLQAMAGPDPRVPLRREVRGRDFLGGVAGLRLDGLRLAYCGDVSGIGADPALQERCRSAAVELADQGAHVDIVDLGLADGPEAFLQLRGEWMVSHHFDRLDRLDELGANVRGNVRTGLRVTTEQIAWARRVRGRIWAAFEAFFRDHDFLLTPTSAVPPFPVEQDWPETVGGRPMKTYVDWIAPTSVLSLTGLPAASVPCGLDDQGLPIGLQVVGPPDGEESVLGLCARIQEMYPIGRPRLAWASGSAPPPSDEAPPSLNRFWPGTPPAGPR